ncbi:hypothetical protein SAMN05216260_12846 [Streptomyces griseoaurantiacus]|uniref:Uncharacterized protein n=1 Tax=Streptomyces griseoaurantiacus TaxID=68213 RepID=A0A1G7WT40_9ACTN|nr:hypothetical protein SAMN05216260_12846 [Streptomyces jietaisiensis]
MPCVFLFLFLRSVGLRHLYRCDASEAAGSDAVT